MCLWATNAPGCKYACVNVLIVKVTPPNVK